MTMSAKVSLEPTLFTAEPNGVRVTGDVLFSVQTHSFRPAGIRDVPGSCVGNGDGLMRPKSSHAFTLIEFLVAVLTIAAVIIAILLWNRAGSSASPNAFRTASAVSGAVAVALIEIMTHAGYRVLRRCTRTPIAPTAKWTLGFVTAGALLYTSNVSEEALHTQRTGGNIAAMDPKHATLPAAELNQVAGSSIPAEGFEMMSRKREPMLGVGAALLGDLATKGEDGVVTEMKTFSPDGGQHHRITAVIVEAQSGVPRAEMHLYDENGNLLNGPEPFWVIGRLHSVRLNPSRSAVQVVVESVTAPWFLPELSIVDASLGEDNLMLRSGTILVELPLTDATGLLGPIPPLAGRGARPLQAEVREPSVNEARGFEVTIRFESEERTSELSLNQGLHVLGAWTGAKQQPLPVEVRDEYPPPATRGELSVRMTVYPMRFVKRDLAMMQRIADGVLREMFNTLDPSVIKRRFANSHPGEFSPSQVEVANSMIDRMTSSIVLINNIADRLFSTGNPDPAQVAVFIPPLRAAVESGKFNPYFVASVWHTIAGLEMSTGHWAQAIAALAQAKGGPRKDVWAATQPLLAICAFHAGDERTMREALANLEAELIRSPETFQGRMKGWVDLAMGLKKAHALTANREDGKIRCEGDGCPAIHHPASASNTRTQAAPTVASTGNQKSPEATGIGGTQPSVSP